MVGTVVRRPATKGPLRGTTARDANDSVAEELEWLGDLDSNQD